VETTLIRNASYLITTARADVIENGAVLIEGNKIKAIGATAELEKDFQGKTVIDAGNKVVMPGLVDSHNHLGNWNMYTLLGMYEKHPLAQPGRLYKIIYPAYTWVPAEAVYDVEMVAYLNLIKTGTTTVSDAFMYPDESARAAIDSGLRVDLSPGMQTNIRYPDSKSPEDDLVRAEAAIQKWHRAANGRINYRVHPAITFTCREWFLKACADLAKKYDVGLSIHAGEAPQATRLAREVWPQGEIRRMYDLGLMGPKSLFFHSCVLEDDELDLYAETGTSVAHCPVSNLKRGVVARVPEMLAKGIDVGLGVDYPNNDLFNVMRITSMIHTILPREPKGISHRTALEMATHGGAKALSLGEETGTLEPGKKADIITLELKGNTRIFPPTAAGLINLIRLNGSGSDVADMIVDGEILMRDRKLTHLDEDAIMERAHYWHGEFIRWYREKEERGEPFVEVLHPDFEA
jgi:5-methylthioadenosine/S-adenosylhomocysteine deaminase